MKYQIVSKDSKLSDATQEKIIARVSKLERLLKRSEDFDCRIVIKFRGGKSKAEITIPTPYLLLRSEAEANDVLDAIDIAKSKLEKQIDKVKSRLDRSSNKVNLGKTFELEEAYAPKEEIFIKNKQIHPTAMTLDDAITQMEGLDHDFYIYEDIEDHSISVVYKRKDEGYGVIEIA